MSPPPPADSPYNVARLNPRLLHLVSPRMRFLRGLGGRVLPCGCLVGIYETYNSGAVATIDVKSTDCDRADHGLHQVVDLPETRLPAYAAGPSRPM